MLDKLNNMFQDFPGP